MISRSKNNNLNNDNEISKINDLSFVEIEENLYPKRINTERYSLQATDYTLYLKRNDKLNSLKVLRNKNEIQSNKKNGIEINLSKYK